MCFHHDEVLTSFTNFLHSNPTAKLEVDPSVRYEVDFGNIVREKSRRSQGAPQRTEQTCVDTEQSEDFVDDPDVPPLI